MLLKKIYTIILILFISAESLLSQTTQHRNKQPQDFRGKITGTIIDSKTSAPIEYANVVLFKLRDSSMITGAITDKAGNFAMEKLPPGKFFIKINFIGYEPQIIKDIFLKPDNPELNVGQISFGQSETQLGAVEVTAERNAVTYNLDKKVLNVDKNLAAQGGTAIDLLKNAPSVNVDFDGNLSVRGSSNVTILIDGKPSAFMTNGSALEQIPAGSISSIEVITNPSAKYDPEGMAGIINIVMKKDKATGFNGIFTLNAGNYDRYSGSANINYSFGKLNLFGALDMRVDHRPGEQSSYREFIADDSVYYINDAGRQRDNSLSRNAKAGFDYQINKKNAITGTFVYRFGDGIDREYSLVNEAYKYLLHAGGDNIKYSEERAEEDGNNKSFDYTANYRRTFDKKGKEFTSDFNFSKSDNDETSSLDYDYFYPWGEQFANESQKQITQNNNTMINWQTDFTNPLGENSRFEWGTKITSQKLDNDMVLQELNLANLWETNNNKSNHFLYNEQIYSIYSTYSTNLKQFNILLGLRLEQTQRNSEQKTTNQNYNDSYFNYFPTLHISRPINERNEFSVSYSKRINRPRSRMLNPFIDYSNPKSLRYGNPKLMPELINSYEVAYMNQWKKGSVSTTLFYRLADNAFSRYTQILDSGVIGNTTINLNKRTNYGVELAFNHAILPNWRINTELSYYKMMLDGSNIESNLTNESFNWTAKVNSTITVWKNMSVQMMFNYNSPSSTPQGTRFEMYGVDMGIKKDFLKNKLSFSFRMSDIFNTMKMKNETIQENYYSLSTGRRSVRMFTFGVTYKLKADNNKRERNRQKNNDENMDFDFE